ncbi:MAG TPA: hypothetical protein VF691_06545 [Cytophagaceae bacterium]|jgi:hypothetical protein
MVLEPIFQASLPNNEVRAKILIVATLSKLLCTRFVASLSMNHSYMPYDIKEKSEWLNNFAAKFSYYAKKLGFSDLDIAEVAKDAVKFNFFIETVQSMEEKKKPYFKSRLKAASDARHEAYAAPKSTDYIFKRLAYKVGKIKSHPDFSSHIGRELGLLKSLPNREDRTLELRAEGEETFLESPSL